MNFVTRSDWELITGLEIPETIQISFLAALEKKRTNCNQTSRKVRLSICQTVGAAWGDSGITWFAADTLPGASDGNRDIEHLANSLRLSSANRISDGGEGRGHQRAR